MTRYKYNSGFTLVELMVSMVFVSMLLLAIALLVMQISSIYNKGITLKSVNETGQVMTSDIQRTINTSDPGTVRFRQDGANPTGGRLCVGATVYAWNYGTTIASGAGTFNVYPTNSRDIRLIKFKAERTTPEGGTINYCDLSGGSYPPMPDQNDVTVMINGGTNNLAIHRFSVERETGSPDPDAYGQPVPGDPTQRIYRIKIVLGTNEPQIRNQPTGIPANGCQVPESRADDEYCAVNEFDFTARAGNRNRS